MPVIYPKTKKHVSKKFSKSFIQPSPHLKFTKEGIKAFFQIVREDGGDKLANIAIKQGLSINLKQTDETKEVQLLQGVNIDAIYYGESVDNYLDGWGLLYLDETVFECQWKQNVPIFGKCVQINSSNQWEFYEGQFDEEYRKNGAGKWEDELSCSFKGEWKEDCRPVQGYGRRVLSDGTFEEGQFENGKANGVHKHYSKEGNFVALVTYEMGILVKHEMVDQQ
ncbi:hypothetical protein FGO68_gene14003 [Halteria grandinella]|uniref:MORN repeat protein n=1 Tax=Halteria grandinella TaxID=5974 RepID=A0A8J8NT62_HALGN|nr:hypothetical protein FGO68_gene14003 [Halteria grandinella]